MTIPHIGSTGVIQNPGVLGAAAQGLQGLPQILLALQQQKAQQARDALNAQYVHAQIGNLDEDNQRAREQMQLSQKLLGQEGAGIGALASLGAPSREQPASYLGNGMVLPSIEEQRPSVDQALGQLSRAMPGAIPGILTKGKDVIDAARKREEADKTYREAMAGVQELPEYLRQFVTPLVKASRKLEPGLATETLKLLTQNLMSPENRARLVNVAAQGNFDLGKAGALLFNRNVDSEITAAGLSPRYIPPIKPLVVAQWQDQVRPPSAEENASYQAFQTMRIAEKGIRALPKGQYMSEASLQALAQQVVKPGFNIKAGLAALVANNPAAEAYLPFLEPELRRIVGTRSGQQPATVMNSLRAFLPMTQDPDATLRRKRDLRAAMIESQGIGGNRIIKNNMGKEVKDLLRDDELDDATPPGFK